MTTHEYLSTLGRQVVTIEQASRIVDELTAGTEPSLLHALRVAAMSPRLKLSCNAGYAEALCPWRTSPLPPREELVFVLAQAKRPGTDKPAYGIMQSHINTLYAIDEFWWSSVRDYTYEIGTALPAQRRWRCWMNSHVRGMGFKCLSWALFIYDPLGCKLLTLDSWHARRLGVDYTTLCRDNSKSHVSYEAYESQVIEEVSKMFPGYLPTVGAACLWFNMRNQGPESHAGLNCRVQKEEGKPC